MLTTTPPAGHRRAAVARSTLWARCLGVALVCVVALTGSVTLTPASARGVSVAVGDGGGGGGGGADACPAGYLALTLDGGPVPHVTERFLAALHRLHAPATFFLIGRDVHQHPELARLIARRGYTVGNHSYHHHDMATMSPAQVRAEVVDTDAALRAAGVTPSRYFRFPFGSRTEQVQREVLGLGKTVAGWNVVSYDNPAHSFRAVARRVIRQLESPHAPHLAVLLLHDSRPQDDRVTLRALPRIVTRARALGYCLGGLHDDHGRLPLAVAGP